MTRISKNPVERRDDIMNASQKLFQEKGFNETRVDEIVNALNLSKGIFYYYFKSKEEILDAIIERYFDEVIREVQPIIDSRSVPWLKRMEQASFKELEINFRMLPGIHKIKNIDIHARMNSKLVERYAPVLATLLEEGIAEKSIETDDPLGIIEVFLVTAHTILDPGVFSWSHDEASRKISILVNFIETSLKAPSGSFNFMYKVFGKIYGIEY